MSRNDDGREGGILAFPNPTPADELTQADVAELALVVTTYMEARELPPAGEAGDVRQAVRQLQAWAQMQDAPAGGARGDDAGQAATLNADAAEGQADALPGM